jgi:hypothetical protein
MNEFDLLDDFLGHGNGYYPQDKERFMRWALEACRNGSEFPYREFERRLTPTAARYYEIAFEFVRLTAQALNGQ